MISITVQNFHAYTASDSYFDARRSLWLRLRSKQSSSLSLHKTFELHNEITKKVQAISSSPVLFETAKLVQEQVQVAEARVDEYYYRQLSFMVNSAIDYYERTLPY